MTRPGDRLRGLLVFLIASAIAFSLAEVSLRTFAPLHMVGIQSAYRYDDELGYSLAPGIHRYKLTDHLEEIKTNDLGSVNFQDSFDAYPTLIFAAGDSFTQGTGNASDASYPFQLDLLLNQDERGNYSDRFGVVNLGLAAFGTEQSLLAIKRYARLVGRPNYILYFGSDNDKDDDLLFASGYRHGQLVDGSPRWGRLVGPLQWLNRFEVFKRLKVAIGQIRRRGSAGDARGSTSNSGSVAEQVWPSIEKVSALTDELNAVLIIGWANPDSPSYPWLRMRAQEAGIRFADWAPVADSVRNRMSSLPLENEHSGGHWRTWANTVIARVFAREVLAAANDRQPAVSPER